MGVRRGDGVLVALAALALVGCHGRDFRTYAVYEAPRSAFRLVALTMGTIDPGADITDKGSGTFILCPLSASAHAARLELSPGAPLRFEIEGGRTGTLTWDFRSAAPSLSHILLLGGYPTPAGAEISESIKAIDGLLGGPKTTFMAGQTTTLRVTRVDFHASPKALTFSSCLAP